MPPAIAVNDPVAKKRPSLDTGDAQYMPVSCLNTFTQDWTIKVKVTKKYDLKTWNNARGQGVLLSVDLMDSSRVQIQATFFNDAAKKWDQEMQEGKVYSMSRGQVKMANKRFTTIPHDHCISFDMQACIQEVEDNSNVIQGSAYNFTTLKSVQEATQVFMIDLIAVLSEVQPVAQIQMK